MLIHRLSHYVCIRTPAGHAVAGYFSCQTCCMTLGQSAYHKYVLLHRKSPLRGSLLIGQGLNICRRCTRAGIALRLPAGWAADAPLQALPSTGHLWWTGMHSQRRTRRSLERSITPLLTMFVSSCPYTICGTACFECRNIQLRYDLVLYSCLDEYSAGSTTISPGVNACG